MIDDLHPTCQVVNYTLQVQDHLTGYWEDEAVFEVEYKYDTVVESVGWWIFQWSREYTMITNKDEAAVVTRIRAATAARKMYRETTMALGYVQNIRLRMNALYNGSMVNCGYRSIDVVWENGSWVE